MKVLKISTILLLNIQIGYSQLSEGFHQLNNIDGLLTDTVKEIISRNIEGKQVVFLGETDHTTGTDFAAMTEVIKYLHQEHGFNNIAFEF